MKDDDADAFWFYFQLDDFGTRFLKQLVRYEHLDELKMSCLLLFFLWQYCEDSRTSAAVPVISQKWLKWNSSRSCVRMWQRAVDMHDSCPENTVGTRRLDQTVLKQRERQNCLHHNMASDLKLSLFKCPPTPSANTTTSCSLVDSATLCEPQRQLGRNEGMPCKQPLSLFLSPSLPLSAPVWVSVTGFQLGAVSVRCI